jgi:hypothetical protein
MKTFIMFSGANRVQGASVKKISVKDDTYWKLLDLKVRMKCRTWEELIDKLHTESEEGDK